MDLVRIAVTGSSGLIGTALVTALHAAGHDVVRLVRRPARHPDEVRWDPAAGSVDGDGLAGVQAAVNLAGAGVGDRRWSDAHKRAVLESRIDSTTTLVKALTALDPVPQVLVSGSAVGYYGDRGEDPLTESSEPGDTFLAGVTRAWEDAALAAGDAGIRVATARTGLVLTPDGGALKPLLLLARLGLAGPLGNGRQWWPWITLDDEVRALTHLLEHDVAGPVNLTAPQPARNADLTHALAHALHRPALLPAPAFALRIALGEFAGEILASQRVLPARLLESGFVFHHQTPAQAAAWVARTD